MHFVLSKYVFSLKLCQIIFEKFDFEKVNWVFKTSNNIYPNFG